MNLNLVMFIQEIILSKIKYGTYIKIWDIYNKS